MGFREAPHFWYLGSSLGHCPWTRQTQSLNYPAVAVAGHAYKDGSLKERQLTQYHVYIKAS